MGPWLVTPDEFDNPDDLALQCTLDGEVMMKAPVNYLHHTSWQVDDWSSQ